MNPKIVSNLSRRETRFRAPVHGFALVDSDSIPSVYDVRDRIMSVVMPHVSEHGGSVVLLSSEGNGLVWKDQNGKIDFAGEGALYSLSGVGRPEPSCPWSLRQEFYPRSRALAFCSKTFGRVPDGFYLEEVVIAGEFKSHTTEFRASCYFTGVDDAERWTQAVKARDLEMLSKFGGDLDALLTSGNRIHFKSAYAHIGARPRSYVAGNLRQRVDDAVRKELDRDKFSALSDLIA